MKSRISKLNRRKLITPTLFSLSVTLFLLGAPLLHADTVVLTNGLKWEKGKVTAVKDGQITFLFDSGREATKPLEDVAKLSLDAEPALAPAEEAYATQAWDKAAQSYQAVVQKTTVPWLKNWASLRLVSAASKVQPPRIDLVCSGLLPLMQTDPKSAATVQLTMPKADSGYLDDAIKQAKSASANRASPRRNC